VPRAYESSTREGGGCARVARVLKPGDRCLLGMTADEAIMEMGGFALIEVKNINEVTSPRPRAVFERFDSRRIGYEQHERPLRMLPGLRWISIGRSRGPPDERAPPALNPVHARSRWPNDGGNDRRPLPAFELRGPYTALISIRASRARCFRRWVARDRRPLIMASGGDPHPVDVADGWWPHNDLNTMASIRS